MLAATFRKKDDDPRTQMCADTWEKRASKKRPAPRTRPGAGDARWPNDGLHSTHNAAVNRAHKRQPRNRFPAAPAAVVAGVLTATRHASVFIRIPLFARSSLSHGHWREETSENASYIQRIAIGAPAGGFKIYVVSKSVAESGKRVRLARYKYVIRLNQM